MIPRPKSLILLIQHSQARKELVHLTSSAYSKILRQLQLQRRKHTPTNSKKSLQEVKQGTFALILKSASTTKLQQAGTLRLPYVRTIAEVSLTILS